LLEGRHVVTALARSAASRAALERQGARTADVDLLEPRALLAAVAGHDTVINLATHIPSSRLRMLLPGAWRENDRLRSEGAANLAEAALIGGATRFVQESFAPVYPDCGDAWIDENTPIEPARKNRSVADAERAALRFLEPGGTAIVLRFALFYGPDSRFFRELIGMVRHGMAPLLGRPDSFISSVSHDDAAGAVLTALAMESGFYNVCDDEPLRHRELADALAEALEVDRPRLPPTWLTALSGSIGKTLARSLRISNAKLRARGWAPRYRSAREGFLASVRAIEHDRRHARAGQPGLRA
jgi:nucleoside-diphosphate-sugar epimerase